MVLESVIIPSEMEKHPKRMLIVGFIYSTIGLFLGLFIFGKYASLAGIFLTAMPLIVIIYRAIELEEQKDLEIHEEFSLMKEHKYIFFFFIFLFIGMVLAYSFWFSILPSGIVEKAFSSQIETIEGITGGNINVAGYTYKAAALETILVNNFRVWFFCILFSFLYGGGAMFILTWNASVIGVAVGNTFRSIVSSYAGADKYEILKNYFTAFPLSLSYMIHGIPEISAYFLGALGGGIISVAVIKHEYDSKEFKHVLIDSLDLLLLSAIVLVVAALIEVYVTPLTL
ncbi:MAG: stage II sporulation protein M [Candidatus Altiarchaeales archaeon]|nr:stage II sporulation protein M [Candidatus Altiarchaeales archaeon]